MQHAGQNPRAASFGLVLLHGRGAGASDIIGLGEALALPDLALIAPEAPGRSWWPTSFLAPSDQMEPYAQAGLSQVDAAIRTLSESGLPRKRIGVLGFSQGACLAAEYLARRGTRLGFGFILSGGLIGTADADTGPDAALYGFCDKVLNYDTNLSGTQIDMSCHAEDPHIPHRRFADSAARLQKAGANVSARTKPGQGHGIDEADIAKVRKLLNVTAA